MIKMKLNNNCGYALVTVLLIITVFIVLFLGFVGQSFSTVKQSERVEEQSQAVALAEMGVTYYQSLIRNIYDSERYEVNKDILEFVANNPDKDIDVYKQNAITFMKRTIEQELATQKEKHKMDGNDDAFFSIESIILQASNEVLEIQFKSTGSEGGSNASLRATVEIELSSLTFPESNPEATGTIISYDYPEYNEIGKPVLDGNNQCVNSSTISSNCDEILITNQDLATTLSGNNNGVTEKTVYSEGPLIIDGNGNKMKGVKFHSEKSITLGGNLNHVDGLFIEAKGSTTLEKNVRADNTNIFVQENLTANSHFELENSHVYVGGTLVMGDNNNKLTIDSSTLCVNGDVDGDKINLTISGQGKLVVRGNINENYKAQAYIVSNDQDFLNQCGNPIGTSDPEIKWNDNISSHIEYEY